MLGCLAGRSRGGARGWIVALLLGHAYAFYSWLLWPVLVRSMLRQLTERRDWTKTEREPLVAAGRGPLSARGGSD